MRSDLVYRLLVKISFNALVSERVMINIEIEMVNQEFSFHNCNFASTGDFSICRAIKRVSSTEYFTWLKNVAA